jgi:radical SAM superfamily enzyme YgiQ (UPF0313 family)
MLKVTLVHASISSCGFNSFRRADDLTESTWISHGLSSIAAYAKSEGFDVDLIDLRKLKNWREFSKEIIKRNPDVVGLTMMSVDFNPVMRCIDIIKKVKPRINVVVGGPHPTVMSQEVIPNSKIDYIVLGEGEISFTNLLKNIQRGRNSERIIQGIKPDLDKLPFVDREIYGHFEEPCVEGLSSPFFTLIAGRGCIYNCSFCQPAERAIFGRRVRRRSVKNVIEELKFLREKHNFQSLMIHDDCLTEDTDWVNMFCNEYEKEGFEQPFICQSRADLICRNEGLVKRMKKAGLYIFIIGFESGNQRILKFLRKGTTVKQNYEAAKICRKYGIKIWANYMLGIPTETEQEAMDTVEMIKEIRPDHCSPAFFTPHPGSDLFKYCIENELSLITSHNEYRRNPYGAKIKNIDYKFLNAILQESLEWKWDKKTRFLKQILSNKIASSMKDLLKKNLIGRMLLDSIKKVLQYGR